jgi:putative phosphoesterase
MKILVFSDIHGNTMRMTDAIRIHLEHGGVDRVFFLGDGLNDANAVMKKFPDIPFDAVSGNCDEFFLSYIDREFLEKEALVTAGGLRFLLIHGHNHFVKTQRQYAANYAIQKKADVLLYGHTHVANEEYFTVGEKRVCAFNPGSVGVRIDGCYHYGILTIKNKCFLPSHGTF